MTKYYNLKISEFHLSSICSALSLANAMVAHVCNGEEPDFNIVDELIKIYVNNKELTQDIHCAMVSLAGASSYNKFPKKDKKKMEEILKASGIDRCELTLIGE